MYFQRNQNLISTYLDNDICIFDSDNCKYLNFNSTATSIWDLIEKPKKIEEIVTQLTKIYDIKQEQCLIEVESFLNNGIKDGLIKTINKK